ncbi:hypothetical protein CKAH01_16813 [Colletotrichum kahawae]|uniref:Uncharacterized protein n=1 Tax=Colletotrichum kahawae TaxID=34407 RepID=A0AAD9YG95_COLKA|nr:hypothetical protein CKAH01_16813 [Colletotrichum kahawae]
MRKGNRPFSHVDPSSPSAQGTTTEALDSYNEELEKLEKNVKRLSAIRRQRNNAPASIAMQTHTERNAARKNRRKKRNTVNAEFVGESVVNSHRLPATEKSSRNSEPSSSATSPRKRAASPALEQRCTKRRRCSNQLDGQLIQGKKSLEGETNLNEEVTRQTAGIDSNPQTEDQDASFESALKGNTSDKEESTQEFTEEDFIRRKSGQTDFKQTGQL